MLFVHSNPRHIISRIHIATATIVTAFVLVVVTGSTRFISLFTAISTPLGDA